MPFIGLTPFLQIILFCNFVTYNCVNALHRAYSISTKTRTLATTVTTGVNALHRAYSISTKENFCFGIKTDWVSMPFIGLTPFLQPNMTSCNPNTTMCQCPSSGLLHFYYTYNKKYNDLYELCQCPSSGLLHFYKNQDAGNNGNNGCQCPSSGLLHFYNYDYYSNIRRQNVSMPFIGLTPFLRYPLGSLCLCGFPDLFLQVIHRIF